MQFGDRLKELRKKHGMSQKGLGDKLDLGQTTIANYEKNIRFPNQEILIRLADVLDQSIDSLLLDRDTDPLEPLDDAKLEELRKGIFEALMEEDENGVRAIVRDMELDEHRVIQLYEKVYKPILYQTGDYWEGGRISVAKEHFMSSIMQKLIGVTFAEMNSDQAEGIGEEKSVVCFSLSGEHHTIGIQMVADYFALLGFKPCFIGNNIPTADIVDMIARTDAEYVAISVTMGYHIDGLANLLQVIRNHPRLSDMQKKKLAFIVGGQGVTGKAMALEIGADGYAKDYDSLKKELGK